MPLKRLHARGILLQQLFCLLQVPVVRPISTVLMICRIKIGTDTLRIPSHIVINEKIRKRIGAARILSGIDTELFEIRNQVLLILLPHDNDIVAPFFPRRPGHKAGLHVFVFMLLPLFHILAIER